MTDLPLDRIPYGRTLSRLVDSGVRFALCGDMAKALAGVSVPVLIAELVAEPVPENLSLLFASLATLCYRPAAAEGMAPVGETVLLTSPELPTEDVAVDLGRSRSWSELEPRIRVEGWHGLEVPTLPEETLTLLRAPVDWTAAEKAATERVATSVLQTLGHARRA